MEFTRSSGAFSIADSTLKAHSLSQTAFLEPSLKSQDHYNPCRRQQYSLLASDTESAPKK